MEWGEEPFTMGNKEPEESDGDKDDKKDEKLFSDNVAKRIKEKLGEMASV